MGEGCPPGVSWAAGRTLHPTSPELEFLDQLRSRAPLGVSKGSQSAGGSLSADGSQSVGAGWGWPLALCPETSGDPAPAHLPPSATAVGGQGCRQSGQRQQQRSRNPARQQRPVPHGLPGLARSMLQLGRLWLLPAAVGRDAAVAASGESSQSGSNSPGGGRRAAWLAVPAGGLRQPRRAAPPLIVAALAEVTIGGCPAGPHCGTRAHRSGAQTMGSERGRGSRPSEARADGLAVGAHPRPLPGGSRLRTCTGRRPLPLGRPPTRARLSPLRVRSPSGTSVRQGAQRPVCCGDKLLGAQPLRCPLWGCPFDVTPEPHPEWKKENCGSGQQLWGDASPPMNPRRLNREGEAGDGWGWGCGQGNPRGGLGWGDELRTQSPTMERNLRQQRLVLVGGKKCTNACQCVHQVGELSMRLRVRMCIHT